MEKAIAICQATPQTTTFIVLTNSGRIYKYTEPSQPGSVPFWTEIELPPQIDTQEGIVLSEKLDDLARLPKGYDLYKRNDTRLYYWQREEDSVVSGQFERMEGAIASARTDYMIRHPQKPPPKANQGLS